MTDDPFRPLKNAFGRFTTGVGVASCVAKDGGASIITINSFTSVSLAPPLVLWCIERRASAYEHFAAADHYAVSILRADQAETCMRFARYNPDPLSASEKEVWESGAPLLTDRLAGFDCKVVARHDAGDHVILVGEVLKFDSVSGDPLVYYASNFADITAKD